MRTLTGHRGAVKAIDFSPDGKTLASSCTAGQMKFWDVETGVLLLRGIGLFDGCAHPKLVKCAIE